MFADELRKSPFCVPERKAALADLWTRSVSRLEQMRATAHARVSDPSSAAVPLSEAAPRFVDAVGRGDRVNMFAHVKACAMLT
eukprot:7846684-Alexandrium_andersonii.AAC.1